jgi:hypothetical protein
VREVRGEQRAAEDAGDIDRTTSQRTAPRA